MCFFNDKNSCKTSEHLCTATLQSCIDALHLIFDALSKWQFCLETNLMGLKKTEQKEYAKYLFTEKTNLTQKEIAIKAGITEKTLTKWINENEQEWKTLRQSLMVTKPAQIKAYYEQLERLKDHINTRKIIYDVPAYLLKPIKVKNADGSESVDYPEYNEKDYPIKIGNFPTSKEADSIQKITNSIQKLEGEQSVGEAVNLGIAFCEYVRDIDFELSKKISEYFDMYIRELMSNG